MCSLPGSRKASCARSQNTVAVLLECFLAVTLRWGAGGRVCACLLVCVPRHSAAVGLGQAVGERPGGGAGPWVMLAGHFVGMLAPSARAENFAAANCDFRTQVCS